MHCILGPPNVVPVIQGATRPIVHMPTNSKIPIMHSCQLSVNNARQNHCTWNIPMWVLSNILDWPKVDFYNSAAPLGTHNARMQCNFNAQLSLGASGSVRRRPEASKSRPEAPACKSFSTKDTPDKYPIALPLECWFYPAVVFAHFPEDVDS